MIDEYVSARPDPPLSQPALAMLKKIKSHLIGVLVVLLLVFIAFVIGLGYASYHHQDTSLDRLFDCLNRNVGWLLATILAVVVYLYKDPELVAQAEAAAVTQSRIKSAFYESGGVPAIAS